MDHAYLDAELRDAIIASDNWQVRYLEVDPSTAAASVAPLSDQIRKKRMRVLLQYPVPLDPSVPREVASVRDVEEARWLRMFSLYVSDTARARASEPFDVTLLFNRPGPGFTGLNGRYSQALPWINRQAES